MHSAGCVVPLRERGPRSVTPTAASVARQSTEGLQALSGWRVPCRWDFQRCLGREPDSLPARRQCRWRAPELPAANEIRNPGLRLRAGPGRPFQPLVLYIHTFIHTEPLFLTSWAGPHAAAGVSGGRTVGARSSRVVVVAALSVHRSSERWREGEGKETSKCSQAETSCHCFRVCLEKPPRLWVRILTLLVEGRVLVGGSFGALAGLGQHCS